MADFSGLAGNTKELSISDVIHKVCVCCSLQNIIRWLQAKMEIDENGTVAVTGVISGIESCMANTRPPTKFELNRPFLAMLVHDSTNTLVFSADVKVPTTDVKM